MKRQQKAGKGHDVVMDKQGIFQLLVKDHRTVEDLFQKIRQTDDDAQRDELLQELELEILAHAHAEDRTFYSVLEQELGAQIETAREEHEEVEELLGQLGDLDADDEAWMATLDELERSFEEHIQEEENDIFVKAQEVIDGERSREIARHFESEKQHELAQLAEGEDMEDIAEDIDDMAMEEQVEAGTNDGERERAPVRGAGGQLDEMTKKELYDKARELQIEGRSHMTKEELARAVRSQAHR